MSVDEIAAAIEELSFSEKLDLMERLSSSIRRAGGNRSTAKISKGSNKSNKPKRTAAPGTLAWTAYTKHVKKTIPEAFEGISKESEKLSIVKGLRAEDPEGYDRFIQNWKASHGNSGAGGGGETPRSIPTSLSEIKAKVSGIKSKTSDSGPAEWNRFLNAVWEEMKAANPDKIISFQEAMKEASRRKAEMEGTVPKSGKSRKTRKSHK
jgi:hypothetical protein